MTILICQVLLLDSESICCWNWSWLKKLQKTYSLATLVVYYVGLALKWVYVSSIRFWNRKEFYIHSLHKLDAQPTLHQNEHAIPLWMLGRNGTHSCTRYLDTLCMTAWLHICKAAAKSVWFRAYMSTGGLQRHIAILSARSRPEATRSDRLLLLRSRTITTRSQTSQSRS